MQPEAHELVLLLLLLLPPPSHCTVVSPCRCCCRRANSGKVLFISNPGFPPQRRHRLCCELSGTRSISRCSPLTPPRCSIPTTVAHFASAFFFFSLGLKLASAARFLRSFSCACRVIIREEEKKKGVSCKQKVLRINSMRLHFLFLPQRKVSKKVKMHNQLWCKHHTTGFILSSSDLVSPP